MGDLMIPNDPADIFAVTQINFLKTVFGMVCDRAKIGEVAGVGQAIEINELRETRIIDYVLNTVIHSRPVLLEYRPTGIIVAAGLRGHLTGCGD